MRPNDSIFLGMDLLPGWLVALVRQLRTGGAEAPPESLAPVPLLKELILVASAIADGKEAPYPQDRQSLHNDLQRSLAALGPESSTANRVAVGAFRSDLNNLSNLLEQGAGARRLRASAQVLVKILASEDSRAAAWLDCVGSFENGASVGQCESRLHHLRTVFEAAGFDWPERAKRISEVISLTSLLAFPKSFDPETISLGDRLADALDVVIEPIAVSADTVVWVAFANSALRKLHLTKGQLERHCPRHGYLTPCLAMTLWVLATGWAPLWKGARS